MSDRVMRTGASDNIDAGTVTAGDYGTVTAGNAPGRPGPTDMDSFTAQRAARLDIRVYGPRVSGAWTAWRGNRRIEAGPWRRVRDAVIRAIEEASAHVTEFRVVLHVRTSDPLIDERELRHLIECGLPRLDITQLDVQVWETDEGDE